MDLPQEGTNEQCQPKRTIGVIRIVLSEQNNGLYPVPGHARFWKGTLAQHKGRLHRSYNGKQEVLIYDYVDFRIPMLERMYHKRLSGYSAIGYTVQDSKTSPAGDNRWYGGINYLGFEKVAQGAMRLSSMAVLNNRDGFTVFQFGKHTIRFRAPYSLEQYTEIREWDNGYLVVMAKYAHSPEPEEEYIDLVPILKNLFFDAAAFLTPIKGVMVCYE